MNYLTDCVKFFILVFVGSAIVGLIFWPENVGRAHRIMYDGYMAGWSSMK